MWKSRGRHTNNLKKEGNRTLLRVAIIQQWNKMTVKQIKIPKNLK
jgi:hypothetical protein